MAVIHLLHAIRPTGQVMLAASLALTVIGIATIFVIDTAYVEGHDGPANAGRQLLYLVAALVVARLILHVGYRRVGEYAYVIFLATVLLLLPLAVAKFAHTTFGGLTPQRNGAYRWINLPGFQMQPSEFMKLAFIIALAWYLRFRSNYRRFRGLLVPFAASIVPVGLILIEPDLGTALLIGIVLFIMMFMAGARLRHLGVIVLLGLIVTPLIWENIRPYQKRRVTTVLMQSDALREAIKQTPEQYAWLGVTRRDAVEWASNAGYQLVASKRALGSGGLAGYGWGEGAYVEYRLLPDSHNDFIFAMVGHQFGMLGCLFVLACYAAIILVGTRIALETTEPFGRILVVGVVALLAAQVITNVGMTLGLLPITGMTLPFVSRGGSSLIVSFASLALVVSVARHRPFRIERKPFEFRRRRSDKVTLVERPAAPTPAER